MKLQTASTIYHTPSGDVVVPNIPSPQPPVAATFESNFAPRWLVFKDHIINTQHVINISIFSLEKNTLLVDTTYGKTYTIQVKDVNQTWKSLQEVFANGVTKK